MYSGPVTRLFSSGSPPGAFDQVQMSSLGLVSGFSRSKRPIAISTTAPPIQSPLPVIPHQKVGARPRFLDCDLACLPLALLTLLRSV